MKDLKSRFLATLGYVYAEGESPDMAFARLRAENPDAFPVPRCDESFLEACAEVVRAHEKGGAQ
jgi:hypothetical protein